MRVLPLALMVAGGVFLLVQSDDKAKSDASPRPPPRKLPPGVPENVSTRGYGLDDTSDLRVLPEEPHRRVLRELKSRYLTPKGDFDSDFTKTPIVTFTVELIQRTVLPWSAFEMVQMMQSSGYWVLVHKSGDIDRNPTVIGVTVHSLHTVRTLAGKNGVYAVLMRPIQPV